MPKLLLQHWRILSYSFVLLCLSCMPSSAVIRLPPPTSIPTAIPPELRIGKVNVDIEGDWVRLTPEQAAKLASQIKYLQQLAEKSYLLGRSEGMIALDTQVKVMRTAELRSRSRYALGVAASLAAGLMFGFAMGVLTDE